jgi:hypothetical protein
MTVFASQFSCFLLHWPWTATPLAVAVYRHFGWSQYKAARQAAAAVQSVVAAGDEVRGIL